MAGTNQGGGQVHPGPLGRQELKLLGPQRRRNTSLFEGVNYLEPDTEELADEQPLSDRKMAIFLWFLYWVVGCITAVVVYCLLKIIGGIEGAKLSILEGLFYKGSMVQAYFFWVGACVLLSLAACSFVMFQPAAASSGIPGLLAVLNGATPPPMTNIQRKPTFLLSKHTLLAKLAGTVLSIPSGLAIGPEGPLIHIGAMMGSHLATAVHAAVGFVRRRRLPPLSSSVLRDLISAGAGCGISAAFHAPIAGVLFVLEEASSFITMEHMEKTFFACVMAYWSVWTLNHFLGEEDSDGGSGSFVKFDSPSGSTCSLYNTSDFFVFLLMGCAGGVLGAAFNAIVTRMARFRQRAVARYRWWRPFEVTFMATLTASVTFLVPLMQGCVPLRASVVTQDGMGCAGPKLRSQLVAGEVSEGVLRGLWQADSSHARVLPLLSPTSSRPLMLLVPNVTQEMPIKIYTLSRFVCPEGEYNALASLFLKPGITAVKNLLLRGAPHLFSPWTLIAFLFTYFLLAALTAGISVPCGLVIPMLLIGGSFGRLMGLGQLEVKRWRCEGLAALGGADAASDSSSLPPLLLWAYRLVPAMRDCEWHDPGSFALVGAGAMLGGSGRLTVFLAVVLLELTNDIKMLPPISFAVVVAMWVGNLFNHHGLYHGLIAVLKIPFLGTKPLHHLQGATTSQIMSTGSLLVLPNLVTSQSLKRFLGDLGNSHNGFPVVDADGAMLGLVTRGRLESKRSEWAAGPSHAVYLRCYMDRSPLTVFPHTPVARTFALFRSLGLRHLVVVSTQGKPMGMVTRKDLQCMSQTAPWEQRAVTAERATAPSAPSRLFGGSRTGSVAPHHP